MPTLKFELIATLVGVDSVTILYRAVQGLAAEVFLFDSGDRVVEAFAHYG